MKITDAIFGRRTIHSYLDDEVPVEVLHDIVLAAHQAPNHRLTWPWRFTVVGRKTREALLPTAYALKQVTAPSMKKRIRNKLLNPGALVVVTQRNCENTHQEREDYAATCCAIQNLMLAAYAKGFGTKWSTGSLTQHPDVCKVIGIDTHEETVVGFVWVGIPAVQPEVSRPPIEHHIRFRD